MATPTPPPPSTSTATGPSGGSGFKLTLKLGGTSTSTSTSTPTTTSIPVAAPSISSAPVPTPKPIPALEREREMLPPPTRAPSHPTSVSVQPREKEKEKEKEGLSAEEIKRLQKEFKGVTADKYRKLKRKWGEAVEARDDTALALYRAQKQISRLREEKTSLLSRVLVLETAAGLTIPSDEPTSPLTTSTAAAEYPLLHPPELPSLEDRPQKQPVITTSTDLSSSSYNAPLGPAPLPSHLPPRLRSLHLRSSIAAQKLRESNERIRIAKALPSSNFSAVSVLGLEGSWIAERVEKVLNGEKLAEEVGGAAPGAGKRRRESTSGSTSKGKGKESTLTSLKDLPNPFAGGAGAAPEGTFRGEHQPYESVQDEQAVVARAQAEATAAVNLAQKQIDAEEGIGGSPSGSGMSYEQENDEDGAGGVKIVPPRKHKRSETTISTATGAPIKPKRLKTHGITSGNYSIPHIPRNADGTPTLPLPVGIMILKGLGTVNPGEHFHTERYIFPIGFECSRKYPSMIDRTKTVEYNCRIVDGGDKAPRFEIDPADQPGVIISAGTPTGAWAQIVKAANKIRERNHSNSVSGPDYYGLAQNVVKALIQELPGANEVPGYIWQNFIEDEPADLMPDGRPKKKPVSDKVRGAKRKVFRMDEMNYHNPNGNQDDDDEGDQVRTYGSTNGGYSPSPSLVAGSMSPSGSPAFAHDPFGGSSSSLNSILHQNSSSNPYSLPPPSLDPSLGQSPVAPPAFDPYAIPAPIGSYGSPSSATSPQLHAAPRWSPGGAGAGGPPVDSSFNSGFPPINNPYGIGSAFPGFDQPGPGGPPYGAQLNRTASSSSSGSSD